MRLTFSLGRLARAVALVLLLAAAPRVAGADVVNGMITGRDGAQMTVTSADGADTVVTLTDQTKVTATAGRLGLRSSDMAVTDLIAGLPVRVETVTNGTETDAVSVSFKASDLKTARQVVAGTARLKAENEALKRRLSEANQYVLKGETTILFATGSAVISAKGKADLKAIAAQALGIRGYLIGVTGHADTTGESVANQALSERRATAVVRYLQKYCGVQPYRVLSANAMGDVHPVGETRSTEGQAQNRRVVIQILTNKGLEGA